MSEKAAEHQIDYVEFPASDIECTKQFYTTAFGWTFEDYGPDYTCFQDGRLSGAFTKDLPPSRGTLVVLYSSDLAASQAKIKSAGGSIVKEIFSFPGGRRFHFTDPSGNELAVWSDK